MKDGYCKTSSEALITVLKHARAKGSAQLVLVRVANHVNKDYGYAWPGLTTLAHETGYSRKHIMGVLQHLEEQKELHIDRQTGRSNHYYIPVAPSSPPQMTSHLDGTSIPEVTGGVTCTALGESPAGDSNYLTNQLTNILTPAPSGRGNESASNQVREEPISGKEKSPSPTPSRGTVRTKRRAPQEVPGFPPERVVNGWNKIPGVVPFQGEIPAAFRRRILQRINDQPNTEWWAKKFEMLARNNWVCGRTDSTFRVSLSWLLGPKGWGKLTCGELDTAKKERGLQS